MIVEEDYIDPTMIVPVPQRVKTCMPCSQGSYQNASSLRPVYSCDACSYSGQVYSDLTSPATCSCVTTTWSSSQGKCILNTDVNKIT